MKKHTAQWSGRRKLAKLSYGHFWILTFISSVENIKFTIFEENSLQKSKIFYGKFYQFFLTCLIYVVKMVIFAHILTKRSMWGWLLKPHFARFKDFLHESNMKSTTNSA